MHVYASAVVLGYGAKVTGGASPVTFDDANENIDPYVFQGTFRFFSAGAARGMGIGWSYIQLGGAFSLPGLKPDTVLGYDQSATASIYGRSLIIGTPIIKECGCKQI